VFGLHLHVLRVGEVLLHIRARAQQTFLLSAPQPYANRAIQLQVQSLQDAHDLDHDRATRAVIGRSGSGVPRVEMSAYHDNLVFLRSAGDLANDVLAVDIFIRYVGLQAHPDLHRWQADYASRPFRRTDSQGFRVLAEEQACDSSSPLIRFPAVPRVSEIRRATRNLKALVGGYRVLGVAPLPYGC
jgi:hypothetical protein